MATTRLMPLHTGKGRNLSTAIADIIDYVKNPQKTDFGKFIYGYECDTRIADAEFLLSKRQYASLPEMIGNHIIRSPVSSGQAGI